MPNMYDFTMKAIDGAEKIPAELKGRRVVDQALHDLGAHEPLERALDPPALALLDQHLVGDGAQVAHGERGQRRQQDDPGPGPEGCMRGSPGRGRDADRLGRRTHLHVHGPTGLPVLTPVERTRDRRDVPILDRASALASAGDGAHRSEPPRTAVHR